MKKLIITALISIFICSACSKTKSPNSEVVDTIVTDKTVEQTAEYETEETISILTETLPKWEDVGGKNEKNVYRR